MGIHANQGFAVLSLDGEIGGGEFLAAGERGPLAFGPADQAFLFAQ